MAGDSGDRKFVEQLPRRSEDYSRWYLDVIAKAELADYSPVRGCMVIRPYGYTIWENMQGVLDARFKATGHTNAYFPLFVPESLLNARRSTSEGSLPRSPGSRMRVVKKLEERLAIRPDLGGDHRHDV